VPTETLATYAALLKEYYTDDRVKNLVYKNQPLFAMLQKFEDFQGDTLPIPIRYGDSHGASADFSTAVANKGNQESESFNLVTIEDYSLASIARKLIKVSQGKKGAWLPAAKVAIDAALHTAVRRAGIFLYGDGSGELGRMSDATPTTTITLSDPHTVTNFERGQTLEVSADGITKKVGTTKITAVDRENGTLTVDTDMSTFTPAAATNDRIYVEGDFNDVTTGLTSWIPATAPSATPFFGVDRTKDVTRLGGVRFDGSSLPVEEALIEGVSRVAREGGLPDYIYMDYPQYRNLVKALGSKVERSDVQATANVGFRALAVESDVGMMTVLADLNSQANVAWVLQMDTWKLYSTGPAVDIFDKDTDQEMLREASADAYEVRTGGYYQLGNCAPGWNGRILLPTPPA
jgi:hypothetical protein